MEEDGFGAYFSPRKTKDRTYCSVYGCSSRAVKNPTLRFHKFPKFGKNFINKCNNFGKYENLDQAEMWMEILKFPKKRITSNTIVCSLHFRREDYILPGISSGKRYLKKTAIPSCNLPTMNKRKYDESNDPNTFPKEEKLEKENRSIEKNREKENNDDWMKIECSRIKKEPIYSEVVINEKSENMNPLTQNNFEQNIIKNEFPEIHEYTNPNIKLENSLHTEIIIKDEIENFDEDIQVEDPNLLHMNIKSIMRNHTDEKPFKCNLCEKSFTRHNNLIEHVKIHNGESSHKCNICSKSFSRKSNLFVHEKTHTGEKAYTCTICMKTFTQQSSLTRHYTVIHSGQDQRKCYSCNICGKKLKSQWSLTQHMLVHTDIKQYECNICRKSFRTLGNLSAHEKIHIQIKTYKCNICSKKSFRKLNNLTQHLKTHMAE